MKTCCVIAEYNPFHNGHALHLRAARGCGCDFVCVIMSGSFVQRGEVALHDKFTRTRWALEGGADAVFELPTVFSLQSAAQFASGAVRSLAAAGLLDALCFGSETPDAALIRRTAQLLRSPAVNERVRQLVGEGMGYPRALHAALAAADPAAAQAAERPNFLLGVEYATALAEHAPGAELWPVERIGAYNDPAIHGSIASATAIRAALLRGDTAAALSALPPFADSGTQFATLDRLGTALLYLLRTANPAALSQIAGMDEGLENLAVSAARAAGDLSGLLEGIATKRYTTARIKRALCCALLGITKQDAQQANEQPLPYLRLLGYRKNAQPLVQRAAQRLPLIARKADADALGAAGSRLLAIDCRATDIQALAGGENPRAGQDFTRRLLVLG